MNSIADNKKETLTSRERVTKAVNHEPVDRFPIDLGMHYSTGISAFAYWNLREYLGLPVNNIYIPDMVQFLAYVEEDILEKFHCDCMLLHPGWPDIQVWNPRGKYKFIIPEKANPELKSNGSWVIKKNNQKMKMPENGYFFDGKWLNLDSRTEEEILNETARKAKKIYKNTDYYTTYIGFGAFFHTTDFEWQCKMITNPKEIKESNKKKLDLQIKKVDKVIDKMGDYIQAVALNSDLGNQSGPMARPSLYEDLCAPFLEKLCSYIHKNSDLKIFMHSCGSIKPFIPTLIDCGVDILNPVQISADNMNPQSLKQEFGSDITFWGGGCNTQAVLSQGTEKEIKENVENLIDIFKPGSGFVFNQVHNILGNVPTENIVTMLETAYENSFY